MIKKAMIFAAGRGERMKCLTDVIPKPLLVVNEQPLINIIIERLREAGVSKIIVNCHYLADKLISHLQNEKDVILAHEKNILGTGGGLLNAIPLLQLEDENEGIFTINSDTIWYDKSVLSLLSHRWSIQKSDLLMLFYNKKNRDNNFSVSKGGKIKMKEGLPLVYSGIQIIKPYVLDKFYMGKGLFSLRELYLDLFDRNDSLMEARGMVSEEDIHHVGTLDLYKKIKGAL